MRSRTNRYLALSLLLSSVPAFADGKATYQDPTGDDNGPGTYQYPTDAVYKKGSFDLSKVLIDKSASKITFSVTVNSNLEDPWKLGSGFSTQMIFIFIDTTPGRGRTEGVPGLNVEFEPSSGWEKVVILSPLSPARVAAEIDKKAAGMKGDILVPSRVKGAGKVISGSVDSSALSGDPSTWGIQVVMQSTEQFPSASDLLTRKVYKQSGVHRFGGGDDGDCDPHVMDLLAGSATGNQSEITAQYDMLKYECSADGSTKSRARLKMVRLAK